MRLPSVTIVVVLLGALGGCARASHRSAGPARTASPAPEARAQHGPGPMEAQQGVDPATMIAEAGPDATVLVMEADDFGGGPDAVTAPPQRPSMPSFMTDVAMAPSR